MKMTKLVSNKFMRKIATVACCCCCCNCNIDIFIE